MASSAYLHHPHLSGDLITFAADDEVWLASAAEATGGGARAWRLTADGTPVAHPRLNPSGTRVAWSSTRDGVFEAFCADVDGGPAKRLTYWGDPRCSVRGWLSDGEVLVTSATGLHRTRRTWAYAVPADDGESAGPTRRLPYGPVGDIAFTAEGAVLIGTPISYEPSAWKRYGGGTGGKIWYAADGQRFERILADAGNHLVNPCFVGGRIAFLSDHEGVGALYSALPDGSQLRRHTELGSYYARHAATDRTRLVYQCAGDLWLLESLDAEPVKLDIRLGGVRTGRTPFPVSAHSELGAFALDRTGRVLAAEVRGTVHRVPAEAGPARTLLDAAGVRGRDPVPLPDGSGVLAVSDAGGEDGLEVLPTDGSAARRIGHGELGRIAELAVSPDGGTVAVATDDCRVLTVDLASGAVTELARVGGENVNGLTFSPDSAYLAWAQPHAAADFSERQHIRMARLSDGTTVDATPPRFNDASPVFTLDGKYLAFLSNRTFDPVYDAHTFDLSFLPGARPYLVTLAEDTPSPFAPELDGRPTGSDKDKSEKPDKAAKAKPDKAAAADEAQKADTDGDGDGNGDGSGEAAEADASEAKDAQAGEGAGDGVAAVRVDFEGLAERIVPFPVEAGRYSSLTAVKDGVVWLDHPVVGWLGEATDDGAGSDHRHRPELVRYDLAKRKRATVVGELSAFAVSGDGARLAYRSGAALKVKASDAKDEDEAVSVDLDRIRVTVDPAGQWRQMYDEAWRLMRDNFWRPDMGGVDWAAMGERYRPLLDRIGSTDELHDLIRELHGELGTSHAYVMPSGSSQDDALAQGLLGADIAREPDGTWRIVRVPRGESSVINARSPLAAPGVAARSGDVIAQVDGRAVDPALGPNPLLAGKAGKPVELLLRRDGAEDRRVVVVPLASETTLRYHEMIAQRRSAVVEGSGGRLGYVHIPDMQALGWAEFHRDLADAVAHDGLIVDIRENAGGHTSQLVVEKLARRVIGWDISRHERPAPYPDGAPRGPIVVVADEFAGSDGDIVTEAIKHYNIGTVVGTRTWGGVIGIDMRYELIDGTQVTQPKFAFWFAGSGWKVENYGVEPDIEVPIAPHDWAAGHDPQLETAIRIALAALEANPPARPPQMPPLE
ncbi:MAG TPA: S41 family peptidase [Actinocrinis sp.]|jgi:tricorn protease